MPAASPRPRHPPRWPLRLAASPYFAPVVGTASMLLVAHALSHLRARDLAAGDALHATPLHVPVVAREDPRAAVALDAAELSAALERWPSLTPVVPASGNVAAPGGGRLFWRRIGGDADAPIVELERKRGLETHVVRYRARDGAIELLASRRLGMPEVWWGVAAGVVAAFLFWFAMRRILVSRQRLRA
ncbi:hypothetical protein [Arenimonas composti]|uniref:Uncharacterized protein n=1 Tax=Arenimonas composti TR7-09 = DSM 18010 TaxID=1121013 RepID=A0A091BGA0_9GAMM|nr:hypothetical protein [Arenimonas composti]KFN50776.1 hypothetical protein P873_05140 [Arenimonas composti TR7-09 = DSM 18010]